LKKEKDEITLEARQKALALYQLDSNNNTPWWFIGDITNWRDSMLEALPVEGKIEDREKGYWLPHIHFDFDTNLVYEDIEQISHRIFKGTRKLTPLVYDGFVTQARLWQGVISGVNIHLDLGTAARNTRYVRKVMLTKIK